MSLPEIISIHAPYKRVRPKYRKQVTAEAIISIHAPYKRVRPTSLIRRTGSLNFNPRTLQESATGCFFRLIPYFIITFQSTHPTRECDGTDAAKFQGPANFNPRTLQESATDR